MSDVVSIIPRPMLTDQVGELVLAVYYEARKHRYRVEVKGLAIRAMLWLPCMHPPIFGIDAEDLDAIRRAAEDMARDIDEAEGRKDKL